MSSNVVGPSSIYPINKIFTRESYKVSGKSMVLHHLVALGQSVDTIKGWLEKNPKLLNRSHENYLNLTPLAVCVLKQKENLARLFLEHGADPKIGDHKGWTPLHHAAVINDANMLKLFKEKTAGQQLLNDDGGSYEDLQELLGTKLSHPGETVCYYREKGKELAACTGQRFTELTRALYCPAVVVSREELVRHWSYRKSEGVRPEFITQLLQGELQKCLSHPPKLSFGKEAA